MLVLGLDVGGTASRALVTTADGARVGFGRAGAANPVTIPLSEATAAIRAAVSAALSDVDPAEIRSVVMGIAGTGKLADPVTAAAYQEIFQSLGVPVPARPVGDVLVAFAAGSHAETGTVLISGTGAIAARIVGGEMTDTADGLGWLLGDLGSGFWLGRAAATATAHALYRHTPGLLTDLVATTVLAPQITAEPSAGLVAVAASYRSGRQAADDLISALHEQEPRHLARLAPLVTEAALAGDPVALSIVDEAAGHLVNTATEVHRDGPIVLAGSVLRECAPVRDAVVAALARRLPDTPVNQAEPGEVGAARLAARTLG